MASSAPTMRANSAGKAFTTPQTRGNKPPLNFGGEVIQHYVHASPHSPITNPPNISKKGLNWLLMTLEQACPPEYRKAQCAFKDSMIH